MGRFTLRLPETLHQELETRAQREGVSLNQYVVYTLTRQVATSYSVHLLPEEHVKEQRVKYEALLESLGRPSLNETQQFLRERDTAEPEEGLTADMVASVEAKIASANLRKSKLASAGVRIRFMAQEQDSPNPTAKIARCSQPG